jgi:hypothetical protein
MANGTHQVATELGDGLQRPEVKRAIGLGSHSDGS